jgi:hypothetical protein
LRKRFARTVARVRHNLNPDRKTRLRHHPERTHRGRSLRCEGGWRPWTSKARCACGTSPRFAARCGKPASIGRRGTPGTHRVRAIAKHLEACCQRRRTDRLGFSPPQAALCQRQRLGDFWL